MASYEGISDFPLTVQANATIAINTLVKLDSSNKLVNAGAGDIPLGWVQDAYVSGDWAAVFCAEGIFPVVAGGAFAVGDYVKCGASGKVVVETTATTPTVFTIGQAREATSADGDTSHVAGC